MSNPKDPVGKFLILLENNSDFDHVVWGVLEHFVSGFKNKQSKKRYSLFHNQKNNCSALKRSQNLVQEHFDQHARERFWDLLWDKTRIGYSASYGRTNNSDSFRKTCCNFFTWAKIDAEWLSGATEFGLLDKVAVINRVILQRDLELNQWSGTTNGPRGAVDRDGVPRRVFGGPGAK
jgi:hypothetical protein